MSALNLPFVRQLEIAVDNDGCPVRAHLDFVLVSVRPRPTVRVLEVKSCTRLPDTLYASYEAQVSAFVGLPEEKLLYDRNRIYFTDAGTAGSS